MRTLLVHTGGIGDFLLACPAIAGLEGEIELLGRPERLQLAVEGGIATRAHDIESSDFHSLFTTPSQRLISFLQRFNRAIVFMRDPDHRIEIALRASGVGESRIFAGLPDADWSGHATDYYANCLEVTANQEFRLQIAPAATARDVLIHPGSGGRDKNWPLENFQSLASELEQQGRTIAWCIGPAEHERAPGMAKLSPRLDDLSLVDLARVLANTRLYIGNDSGITHLAALVGCPTIAIFGPTNSTVWAPRGIHVRLAQSPDGFPSLQDVMRHCT